MRDLLRELAAALAVGVLTALTITAALLGAGRACRAGWRAYERMDRRRP